MVNVNDTHEAIAEIIDIFEDYIGENIEQLKNATPDRDIDFISQNNKAQLSDRISDVIDAVMDMEPSHVTLATPLDVECCMNCISKSN